MKERPIIFSAPMVRAILEGRKSMTRRVIKPQPQDEKNGWYSWASTRQGNGNGSCSASSIAGINELLAYRCPYGQPGDRLWVRETSAEISIPAGSAARETITVYKADNPQGLCVPRRWRPSIYMPRWASRILLEVTAVRIERVQDITDEDAIAEGCTDGGCLNCGESEPCDCTMPMPDHRDAFAGLWDSINGKRWFSWVANPWVWVIEFKRIAARPVETKGEEP